MPRRFLNPIFIVFSFSMVVSLASCGSTEPDKPVIEEHYTPRNNNYIDFSVKAGDNLATYYYYVSYGETTVDVGVDVIDHEINRYQVDIGYNDNIEFNCSIQSAEPYYDVNNTYNIMMNAGKDAGWVRKAYEKDKLDPTNLLDSLVASKVFAYERVERTLENDGYQGYSIDFYLSYSLWNSNKAKMLGKFTIEPSARNTSFDGQSEWRSNVKYNMKYSYASLAVLIDKDGKPMENTFDLPNFNSVLKQKGKDHQGLDYATHFAGVSTNFEFKEYKGGAQIFKDRMYFSYYLNMPEELKNKAYSYGNIADKENITVTEAGYLTVIAPAKNYDSLINTITGYGFTLINNEQLPALCYSSTGMIGTTEAINYYVKWCEVGEKFTFNKYHVTISKAQNSYSKDQWETNFASVIKLSDEKSFNKYAPSDRLWQGIPGIDVVTKKDGSVRLWSSFFTGGEKEPKLENYCVYYFSDDDGETWIYAFAVDFKDLDVDESRTFDNSLAVIDNKLYLYWNQTGYSFNSTKCACAIVYNPDIEINGREDIANFEVGNPFFVGDGLKLNKPRELTTGELLFMSHDITNPKTVNVYSSLDRGLTWNLKGIARVWNYNFVTESSFAQIDDLGNELVMYSRCDYSYNVAVSYSHDGGKTWTDGTDALRVGPSSRGNTLRLKSGNIMYIHHLDTTARERLCIFFSTNKTKSYDQKLILDVRSGAAYPDMVEAPNGYIYIIWDYNRYSDKQILFTKISEDELLNIQGTETLDTSRIKQVCSIVEINKEFKLKGKVTTANGEPIENAVVSFKGQERLTNANGEYQYFSLITTDKDNTLTVNKDGYKQEVIEITNKDVVNANYRLVKNVKLNVKEKVRYCGFVYDIENNPIENVSVSLDGNNTTTDASGYYEFDQIYEDNYNVVFTLSGYNKTTISTKELVSEQKVVTIDDLKLLKLGQSDLGNIGGTNGAEFKLWSERNDSGITFYAKGKEILKSTDSFEAYVNVYGHCNARSLNTFYFRFEQPGTFLSKHWPKNSKADLDNTTGVSCTVTDNKIIGYVPYTVLSQYLEGYSINKDSTLSVSFVSVNTGNNKFDVWYGKDIPSIKDTYTDEIARGNTKSYVNIKADGSLSRNYVDNIYSFNDLADLVKSSVIYKEGVDLTKDNLITLTNDWSYKTVAKDTYMFSDRPDKHCFDDYRMKCLDGLNFLYKSVLLKATVTVETSGYVILGVLSNQTQENNFLVPLIKNFDNPGIASSPAYELMDYYFGYVEAGTQLVINGDSLLFLK